MTTVKQLTPDGRGAIAVIEASGPQAIESVDRWFAAANGLALGAQPIDATRFGRWLRTDGVPGEELVVIRTGEDRVEIHCHGGAAAPAAILGVLKPDAAPPRVRGGVSLTEQAHTALAEAPTERVAAVLLDQANGALEHAVHAIHDQAERGNHAAAETGLRELLARWRVGERLVRPWRVVLAGPPNAGKSSLINALVGYDRALVYDRPGTTRDVVTATTALDGWPVTLADTAGDRETDDPLESAGVELTRRVLATADVAVLVGEATRLGSTADNATRSRLRDGLPAAAAVVSVANKSDLAPAGWAAPPGVVATNARTGTGVDALLAAIAAASEVTPPPPGEAVPFRPEHAAALEAALQATPNERPARLRALLAPDKL